MSKRIISFQLEKEELKALDEAAKVAGTDRSKFLRNLINDYVEGKELAKGGKASDGAGADP
ncbi:MAG: CopG family transcriptional regulator [Armatimonadetes bacterium]|nr:CopG family transcriptional regulator [Armatimonadota bacterium]